MRQLHSAVLSNHSYQAVKANCEHHEKEANGPKWSPWNQSESFWIRHKRQSRTWRKRWWIHIKGTHLAENRLPTGHRRNTTLSSEYQKRRNIQTSSGDFGHANALDVSHVTQNAEDHEPSVQRCHCIPKSDQYGIPETKDNWLSLQCFPVWDKFFFFSRYILPRSIFTLGHFLCLHNAARHLLVCNRFLMTVTQTS